MGITYLSKLTGLVAIGAVFFYLFWKWVVKKQKGNAFVIVSAVFLLSLFPWFVFNLQTYGEPTGFRVIQFAAVAANTPRGVINMATVWGVVRRTFQSFWISMGQTGGRYAEQNRILWSIIALGSIIVAVAGIGEILKLWRGQSQSRLKLLSLGVLLIGAILLWLRVNLQVVQPQGRYLFIALPSIGLWVGLGLSKLIPKQITAKLSLESS